MRWSFWKYLELGRLRPPELICFDHLYSEFLSMKLTIDEEGAKKFIDDLVQKVKNQEAEAEKASVEGQDPRPRSKAGSLSWDELYYFEMILADRMPAEKLRSKIVRLRSDYRSIVSEKEFTEYLSSKPKELQDPPEPQDAQDEKPERIEKLMRTDLKDLLGRIYFKYAILPVREERLTDLAWFAARLCLFSLFILLGILAVTFVAPLISDLYYGRDMRAIFETWERLGALTVFVVVISGAMGGFVSALQRIQSPPTEGDSLYNLSLLFHGSKSVFIAPITGAIFAILLYLMFAAGILQGTFFPTIYTPPINNSASPSPTPTPTPTPVAQPSATSSGQGDLSTPKPPNLSEPVATGSPPPAPGATQPTKAALTPTPAAALTPTTTPTAPPSSPTPSPTPKSGSQSNKGLNVFEFLRESGPIDGRSYALLIIWCFIAGFAERLVPDALDRLISNSKSSGSK